MALYSTVVNLHSSICERLYVQQLKRKATVLMHNLYVKLNEKHPINLISEHGDHLRVESDEEFI